MNNIKLNKTKIYRVDLYVSLKDLPALHNFENLYNISKSLLPRGGTCSIGFNAATGVSV